MSATICIRKNSCFPNSAGASTVFTDIGGQRMTIVAPIGRSRLNAGDLVAPVP
jgi:hypothetical protein